MCGRCGERGDGDGCVFSRACRDDAGRPATDGRVAIYGTAGIAAIAVDAAAERSGTTFEITARTGDAATGRGYGNDGLLSAMRISTFCGAAFAACGGDEREKMWG